MEALPLACLAVQLLWSMSTFFKGRSKVMVKVTSFWYHGKCLVIRYTHAKYELSNVTVQQSYSNRHAKISFSKVGQMSRSNIQNSWYHGKCLVIKNMQAKKISHFQVKHFKLCPVVKFI